MSTLLRRVKGRQIWITSAVNAQMVAEADAQTPLETGGLLLGYWTKNSEAVVTHYVGPGPNAVHGEHHFEPDYEYQEAEVARLYEASNNMLQYLGDWHTHPGGVGQLSAKDGATLVRISKALESRVTYPIMVILAGHQTWSVFAWQLIGQRLLTRRHAIVSLTLATYEA